MFQGFNSYSKATIALGKDDEPVSQVSTASTAGFNAQSRVTSTSTASASTGSVGGAASKKVSAAVRVEKAAAQLIDLLLAKSDDSANDGDIQGYLRDNDRARGRARRPRLFPPSLSESSLTPLQQLVLEEVGKLLGAGIRSTWSTLRDASGKLPSGRSVLGSLIDLL
jgi:hypothetical protein